MSLISNVKFKEQYFTRCRILPRTDAYLSLNNARDCGSPECDVDVLCLYNGKRSISYLHVEKDSPLGGICKKGFSTITMGVSD